jgi:hypothetical protein
MDVELRAIDSIKPYDLALLGASGLLASRRRR